MPKWLIAVMGVFALIGVFYTAMLALVWVSPPLASCTAYPVMSVLSPSGQFRAEVKNEVCESKHRHDTVVWLTDGTPVNLGGKTWTALIASSTQSVAPGSYAPLQLRLLWINDSELEISFPAGTELSSRAETRNGVKVVYREQSAS